MFKIPVLDANDSLTEIVLDEETYFLHLSWNSEGELWTLSIENAYNDVVVSGIVVVPDTPLLQRYRHLHMPAGDLVAVTPDLRDTIGREALPSGDVALVYITAEELANGTLQ
jgi:hypothetical protein